MKELRPLTLHEKIAIGSGRNFWHTKAHPMHQIPSVLMSDGPAGIRRQVLTNDMLGLNDSVPATCFPAEVTLASSWNRSILYETGKAIAREAKHYKVQMVLGPGVNIKRNPLCGRIFEYFSEDPFISGELAASYINGMQNEGIASCIKHFACNSQEFKRFSSNSIVDERTLREIYLSAFERAISKSKPKAVMCAYNKLNGIHCASNKRLLTDILRTEWGFNGIVVSDWGALVNRIESYKAGCDLAMPGGSNFEEKEVYRAVKRGKLDRALIEQNVQRIKEFSNSLPKNHWENHSLKRKNYEFARKAAEDSFVLLKNSGSVLPLSDKNELLFIGAMAEELRIQGAGSSHINTWKKVELKDLNPHIKFVRGVNENGYTSDVLIDEAVNEAKAFEEKNLPCVIVAGLPASYESEGFDRKNLLLPLGVNRVITEVSKVNRRTVVALISGGVVELPWINSVSSVLYLGLPGEAGAEALLNVLTGKTVPSGKLTETWPLKYSDCPSSKNYGEESGTALYGEGIFVGYRYYETQNIPVQFCFGHGLSYTTFSYSDIALNGHTVSCTVKNEGECDAQEIVQLYVEPVESKIKRARLELKGFEKVFIRAGESVRVEFTLTDDFYRVWGKDGWCVPGGQYIIHLGSSCRDLRLSTEVSVKEKGNVCVPEENISAADFQAQVHRPFTMRNTLNEMKNKSGTMNILYKIIRAAFAMKFLGKRNYSPQTYRLLVTSCFDNSFAGLKQSAGLKFPLLEFFLKLANAGL